MPNYAPLDIQMRSDWILRTSYRPFQTPNTDVAHAIFHNIYKPAYCTHVCRRSTALAWLLSSCNDRLSSALALCELGPVSALLPSPRYVACCFQQLGRYPTLHSMSDLPLLVASLMRSSRTPNTTLSRIMSLSNVPNSHLTALERRSVTH